MSLDALPPVLTVDEVASVLRCSRRHVYRLVAQGTIPALPLEGRMTRVSRQTLERFLGLSDANPIAERARGLATTMQEV